MTSSMQHRNNVDMSNKNNYKGFLSTAIPISNIAYYTISKSFLKLCHVNY